MLKKTVLALAVALTTSISSPALAADRTYSQEEWQAIIEDHWHRHESGLYAPGPTFSRTLALGARGGDVARLREHLSALGFGDVVADPEKDAFDETLRNHVKAWQRRMGLKADGIVGPISRAVIANPGPYVRSRLNDALRAGPRIVRDDEIYVDIVAQRVEVRRESEIVFEGQVIVGRKNARTPALESTLEAITINPHWFVPPGIMRRTKWPRLLAEPEKLVAEGFVAFERVDGRLQRRDLLATNWEEFDQRNVVLRQNHSSISALGKFKFEMPNSLNIYLHDTPDRRLFALDERLYSSGCVRVENIAELSRLLIGDEVWNARRLDERLAAGDRTLRIDLEHRLPVKLDYRVATILGGDVVIREDIYERLGSVRHPQPPARPATAGRPMSILPSDQAHERPRSQEPSVFIGETLPVVLPGFASSGEGGAQAVGEGADAATDQDDEVARLGSEIERPVESASAGDTSAGADEPRPARTLDADEKQVGGNMRLRSRWISSH